MADENLTFDDLKARAEEYKKESVAEWTLGKEELARQVAAGLRKPNGEYTQEGVMELNSRIGPDGKLIEKKTVEEKKEVA